MYPLLLDGGECRILSLFSGWLFVSLKWLMMDVGYGWVYLLYYIMLSTLLSLLFLTFLFSKDEVISGI